MKIGSLSLLLPSQVMITNLEIYKTDLPGFMDNFLDSKRFFSHFSLSLSFSTFLITDYIV